MSRGLTAAVLAAVRAAEGPDGRLPSPSAEQLGDIFPFDGELLVRPIDAPTLPEPPRRGDVAGPCDLCDRPDDDFVWVDDRWRLVWAADVSCLPAALLVPRRHADLDGLDDDEAAEQGRLIRHVERAMAGLDGVARVHVNRWGDGSAHLHWWFFARPEGVLQLRGSCLPVWLDVLPALPAEVLADAAASVAERLVASYGGRRPGSR